MAIAIVALLAFGGSYAYFTASAGAGTATFTTATLKVTNSGAKLTTISDKVVPGDKIVGDSGVKFNVTSTADSYLAVVLTIKKNGSVVNVADIDDYFNMTAAKTIGGTEYAAAINTTDWTECGTTKGVYIKEQTAADAAADVVFLKNAVVFAADEHWTNGTMTTPASGDSWEGVSLTFTISVYQVQKDNLGTGLDSEEAIWTAMKTALGSNYVADGVAAPQA